MRDQSKPVAWAVFRYAGAPPSVFNDEQQAKDAAFASGVGARPLYLSQVSPQENSTDKPTKADVDRLLDRIDSSQRTLVFEQEAEIARLKSRLRFCDGVIRSGDVAALTDAEREALAGAATVADAACDEFKRWVGVPRWANGNVDDSAWQAVADRNAARAATLRGLLERLG